MERFNNIKMSAMGPKVNSNAIPLNINVLTNNYFDKKARPNLEPRHIVILISSPYQMPPQICRSLFW